MGFDKKGGKDRKMGGVRAAGFSGDGTGMSSGSHGQSLISGWRSSDNGRMCIVNLGITEYSRLHPFASGAALPQASTKMSRATVPHNIANAWQLPA